MHLLKTTFLLLSCFSSLSYSQPMEPIQPFPNTTYSTGIKDRITGDPMPDGNWAFDITIQNPNDRAIYCPAAVFLAHLDDYGNNCKNAANLGIPLSFGNLGNGLELGPRQKLTFRALGDDQRIALATSLGKETLEYCGREAWNAECGFNCSNGKKFDEKWQETINVNGYRKFQCSKDGTVKELEVFCDNTHKPGDSWFEGITQGKIVHTCQPSGAIVSETKCDSIRYEAVGSQCLPAKCGSTPHGQVVQIAPNKWAKCNMGSFEESCGPTFEHGESYTTFIECNQPCYEGPGTTYLNECNLGFTKVTSTGYCRAKPNCKVIGPPPPDWN